MEQCDHLIVPNHYGVHCDYDIMLFSVLMALEFEILSLLLFKPIHSPEHREKRKL